VQFLLLGFVYYSIGLEQIMFGTNTTAKFIKAKNNVIAAMISEVPLNPYKSVNLPPITGAIADPNAYAIF